MVLGRKKATGLDPGVGEACDRNIPLEIHYDAGDGTLITARSRFLSERDNELIVEAPQYADRGPLIPPGGAIRVIFMLASDRYTFTSEIIGEPLVADLNDRQRVRAVMIGAPGLVTKSQRRATYRIRPITETVPVVLTPAHPDVPAACAIGARRVECRIYDLSIGGLSLTVDWSDRNELTRRRPFFVNFQLPGDGQPYLMFGQVQHVKKTSSNSPVRCGFAFRPWPGADFNAQQQTIARWIADFERRMLRRRKALA